MQKTFLVPARIGVMHPYARAGKLRVMALVMRSIHIGSTLNVSEVKQLKHLEEEWPWPERNSVLNSLIT